ncbi:MAG: CvpA family protein [Gammaproteobacteria bacterium]|jgi:membrane protein required for colicin V production
MNWVDASVVTILLISVTVSVVRGFIREVLSLLAWIVSFWAATVFAAPASRLLEPYVSVLTVRLVVAFVGVLVIALLLGAVINHLVGKLVDKTGLSGLDRLLGAVFGLARGVAIVGIAVLVGGLTALPAHAWWQEAYTLPPFEHLARYALSWLPDDLSRHFSY